MKLLKQFWCFLNGHDWTEFSTKSIDNVVYYSDRKCGCCGKLEILMNNYAYSIHFLGEDNETIDEERLK